MKAHYAFNEQVAMVDFTYNENKSNDKPLAKVRHETSWSCRSCRMHHAAIFGHVFVSCRHTSRLLLVRTALVL